MIKLMSFLKSIRENEPLNFSNKHISLIKQKNKNINNIKCIVFFVWGMDEYSGGHRSILKLASSLQSSGLDVYLYDVKKSNIVKNQKIADAMLGAEKVRFISELKNEYDLGVATYWITAYSLLKNHKFFKNTAYFIQDFEPGFYPLSHLFWQAFNSYRLGHKNISLGDWNSNMIKAYDQSIDLQSVPFPCDLTSYPYEEPQQFNGGVFNIVCFVKFSFRRGLPFIWQLLTAIKKKYKGNVCIKIIGLTPFAMPLPFGSSLGKVSPDNLKEIYKKTHLGIAPSFSNISLVPYEMQASGVPCIDFVEGSASNFIEDDSLIFVNLSIETCLESIDECINDYSHARQKVYNFQNKSYATNWDTISSEFIKKI